MRRPRARRLAAAAGTLVTLAAALAAVVWIVSARQLARTLAIPVRAIAAAPGDPAAVARGAHLVDALGKCADCHGEDLGGAIVVDDPAFGRVVAPNLTPAGPLAAWSDGEIVRALRHGVSRDGRRLLLMPSDDYNALSDEDAAAVVAYLRTRPAVVRDLSGHALTLLARLLLVTGQLPILGAARIDHARPSPARVAAGVTPAYGRYLADVGGRTGCHGP